nr:integrase, catalytic region, zinc finger, CCHC-type, peptidase aspartic, catalytic [Tanacetum cinerariifolium]
MKTEALKEQATAAKPVKALTVYPPNTPVKLVSRVLPTKSQVKVNIFALIQLFSEFEKTCKKRITPTGLTEGERGFEQTKECYLTDIIPFFKMLKEHFEGIQKALTTELKEMKAIFDELEVEVDQNAVNRKCDEIERKNLLIANDTLIANCLSKETTALLTDNENLKDDINAKLKCVNIDSVTPKVLAPGMYAIDVEPIPPRLRNTRNFMKKFIETVRFRNDHFGVIMGYGDYVIGNSVISRVYYVEGLGYNLFSVRQFCDSDLEVAFKKNSCYVQDTYGVEITKAVVATACYTQNRSLIHTHHNKTPYELVHNKKPDLTFLRIFGALCYPTNNSEDLGKL